ncbi:hypothetical protein GCM10025868_44930 [Angustibacter aerolatus]|uniref:(d)CMP kinase n=1 Tax=Angustibacter aerolatus TaxID=1162965 RepID=A0ABQ6JMJ4_9ACTN|nr:hypothetical protein GCM10025868_44930 [Angustibacter aerolatus]
MGWFSGARQQRPPTRRRPQEHPHVPTTSTPSTPDRPRRPVVVAVDGPSGSGKSSVSRAVARRLGLAFLDTGAMYRALTWWCLQQGVDLDDAEAVAAVCRTLPLEMGTDPDATTVAVGGTDVAAAIRTTEIARRSAAWPPTSTSARRLRERQRDLIHGAPNGCVAEGAT